MTLGVAAALLAAGAGVVAVDAQERAAAPGTFGCALPGGEYVDVPVEFGLTVPEAAPVGTPVTVTPSARLVLPATLRSYGSTVEGLVAAEIVVRQEKTSEELDIAAAELPAAGDLTVTAASEGVEVTPEQGKAQVRLTGLTASLRVGQTTISCTANAVEGALGSVDITPAAVADLPPGLPYNFDLTVTTRLAKLKSDVVIGPGTFSSVIGFLPGPDGRLPLTGDLSLPPAKAYLVVFRFMPVTNTITLTPVGQATGSAVLTIDGTPNANADIDVVLRVDLRVSEVFQDGVPLAVGDACHTATPIDIRLRGKVLVVPGSVSTLTSVITIPPFTGCGTTEDLDPLITGLVSGPGNPLTNRLVTRPPV
ncbi:hypothetical protein JOD54_003725 [Actinokineospora baliensis]|uniref:hypothetical protein n=1 Tax=Actinokineospora baliensis TaxID=547056 RepID=UPI00195B82BE|nr:hypothetical protein [Actinokineospora baliensis]MBM7773521.1 hypothetical protein [Actinokineospora baliensis]